MITEEELRQYFLFLKNVKHYSRNTITIAICGFRFLYQDTLNREWAHGIVRPAPEKKLPVILSAGEAADSQFHQITALSKPDFFERKSREWRQTQKRLVDQIAEYQEAAMIMCKMVFAY